jgi:hypothetical protein
MSTNLPAVNATATVSVTPIVPHVSWLKKLGHAIGVALGFIAKEAVPVSEAVGAVVGILDPAAQPLILAAESIVSKIAAQAAVTESAFTAVGQASNGPAKLQAVVNSISPEVDQWVTNSFPGAAKASTLVKQGLVNSVVALLNEVDGNLALTAPPAGAIAAASAAQAAVAAAKS